MPATMIAPSADRWSRRRLRAVDAALVAWAAAWVVLAVLVAVEVRGLSDLSRTITTAGSAVEQSGELLKRLDGLPLIGDDVSGPAERVVQAGRQAQRSGRSSRASIRRLSILLAMAIALAPSAPLLLYVPWRVRLARERRALRDELSAVRGPDPALVEVLARRAVQQLPYRTLRRVSADPWGDIRAGRHEALARAELARLGLDGGRRPGRPAGGDG